MATDRVLEFAREALIERIELLLDDPYGFDPPAGAQVMKYRQLAFELEVDFDEIVNAASAYERERLLKIEEEWNDAKND